LKILFINTDKNWSEYSEQNIILASILKKRGHQVFIALEDNSKLKKQAWMKRLEILPIKSMCGLNPLTISKLSKFIIKNNIDLVHIYSYKSISQAIKAAMKANLPRLIITHHPGFPHKLGFFIKKSYIKQPFHVIATSRYIENNLHAQQIKTKKVHILPEGVDLLKYQDSLPFDEFYEQYSIPPEFFLIGCQSPASNKEDSWFLLNTVQMICRTKSNAIFLLFEGFESGNFLAPIIQKKGLAEKLIIIDPKAALPNILSAINLMIVPYNRVNYRCFILKAMAMAKPVITRKFEGIEEIIQQEKNGIILSSKDYDSFSAAISNLTNQEKKLKELGFNARKVVEKRFNIESLAIKHEQIYSDILKKY